MRALLLDLRAPGRLGGAEDTRTLPALGESDTWDVYAKSEPAVQMLLPPSPSARTISATVVVLDRIRCKI